MVGRAEALDALLRALKAADYAFVAVTPATHARVLVHAAPAPINLRDIFGWNRWFEPREADPSILALLRAADALDDDGARLRSRVRVASLGNDLLLHSSFPTDDADSVFLGPDTYRFARFIETQLLGWQGSGSLVDMGAGSGAGAIAAATVHDFDSVTMVDRNASALAFARVNAAVAEVIADAIVADQVPRGADLVIANPPYMIDALARTYRDGGGLFGGAVALDWVRQSIDALVPGGAMLLYTGAAVVTGSAPLVVEIEKLCAASRAALEVAEIDPDVFGEELDRPCYETVERIAAFGVVIRKAG